MKLISNIQNVIHFKKLQSELYNNLIISIQHTDNNLCILEEALQYAPSDDLREQVTVVFNELNTYLNQLVNIKNRVINLSLIGDMENFIACKEALYESQSTQERAMQAYNDLVCMLSDSKEERV